MKLKNAFLLVLLAVAGLVSPAAAQTTVEKFEKVEITSTAAAALTVSGGVTVSGVGPHAIGGSTDTSYQLTTTGTFAAAGSTNAALRVGTTVTTAVGASATLAYVNGTLVEAASGTHALLAGVNIGITGITGGVATVTDTASLYIQGAMSATVTGENYAIWSAGGQIRFDGRVSMGGAPEALSQHFMTGTFSTGTGTRRAFRRTSTVVGDVGASFFGDFIDYGFTEAASGNHPLIAMVNIQAPTVMAGVATVTDTAQLYIAGAMSATVTGVNYALWSDAGVNRFDGPVITGSQAVDLDAVTTFAATSSYIVLTCTGAETLNTITLTGVATGTILDIEHGDTDCTIADDDTVTAANAIDLTGTATNDVGAVNKIISLRRHSSGYWIQIAESDN